MKKAIQRTPGEGALRSLVSPASIFSIVAVIGSLALGLVLGRLSESYTFVVAGVLLLVLILLLKLDEITVVLVVIVHMFIDYYLGFNIYQLALIFSLFLLLIRYFARSAERPWSRPRLLWLWIAFLLLNVYPTILGGDFRLTDAIAAYFDIVLGAFLMFWLGNITAKDLSSLRRIFQGLVLVATFIAVHTIIEATTGKFLFQVASSHTSLTDTFQISGTNISRAGSFAGNPNGNAAFLGLIFPLSLGLWIESRRLKVKLCYVVSALLILLALMFTYSTGAWLAVLVGTLIFLLLTGRPRYSLLLIGLIALVAVVALVAFPTQIAAQFSHSSDKSDLSLHLADWQTALRVIEAYPLTGVGLGSQAYLLRAEPFRVPAQTIPLAEPDNAFLQWGATAGALTLLVFLALLGLTIWCALRYWRTLDIRYRPFLGAGITALIVLSIDSLSVDGWTASPITYSAWLIAGVICSPLLGRVLRQQSVNASGTALVVPGSLDEQSKG